MEYYRLVGLGICVIIYAVIGAWLLTESGKTYIKRYAKNTLFAKTAFIKFMGSTLIGLAIIEVICLYIFSTR